MISFEDKIFLWLVIHEFDKSPSLKFMFLLKSAWLFICFQDKKTAHLSKILSRFSFVELIIEKSIS